jgi:cardiolipin synthase
VPVFLIFGHRRYPGYIAARRTLNAEMAALKALAAHHAPSRAGDDPADEGRIRAFERLAGVPLSSGNALKLLVDGAEAFPEIFDAIDAAQSYILAQFYTIEADGLGQDFAARLIAKARAGIRVYLLYDAIGSRLPRAYLDRLREAGVNVRDFHAIRRSRGRLQVNFRNHRKIVVVDGKLAFTGGVNLSDTYVGGDPRLSPWRDTMVRVEGPCAAQLQFVFAEDWLWSSGEKLALDWSPPPAQGQANALVLAPGPADPQETGSLYFVAAIAAARRRIWIASAYFVPDVDVLSALKVAALRGVEVRILVPDRRDHWLVWLAAFAYFDEVKSAGVEIWRYMDGFQHQKVLLIDDNIASVGTVNLDNRSCRLNFEVTVVAADRGFAGRVERMLHHDFALASRIAPSLSHHPSRLIRIAAPVARLLAPLL